MKKIAIITRRAGHNMGSSLQAYAISKFIQDLGYQTVILDYNEYGRFLMWRIKPQLNKILLYFFNILPNISKFLFPTKFKTLKRMEIQKNKFQQFEKQYMLLSTTTYRKISDFNKTLTDYNAYVCGSDQIWSPYMFDPVFLLAFVPNNIKKIAYAPSIGVTKAGVISKEECDMIKCFDWISCREQDGSKLLAEITNTNVQTVLDPTLMVNFHDWEVIADSGKLTVEKEYILTYFLHIKSYENNIPNKFITKLKEKTGLSVINIQMSNMAQVVNADKHIFGAGPQEFLFLIKHAKYVATNSFHCCIFSFIFNKKFFVFERYRKKSNLNENQNPRIYSLLKLIDSNTSLIKNENTEINLSFIPYQERNLKQYIVAKNKSIQYIHEALKGLK